MPDRIRKTALQAVMSERWAITEDGLRTILAIANREGDIEALKSKIGEELPGTRRVERRGSVAVVPINGPIFRYANLFTEFSGATSLGVLSTDFQKAIEDDSVKSLLLWPDTPGGQVNGTNEFSAMIHRAGKPVWTYVGGTAASAGYWAISGSQQIIIDETAILGSIGVVATIRDDSKARRDAGIEHIEIVSSASPNKRVDPKTEEGRKHILAEVDALAEVMIAKIALHRGVTVEKVKSGFGRGGVLVGAAAVDAGMADRLGSFEDVIEEMEQEFGGSTHVGFSAQQTPYQGEDVMKPEEIQAKYPDSYTAIFQAGRDEGKQAGLEEGKKAGIQAEVDRVAAVNAALIPGHEALIAKLAADGKTTGAEAALAVNQAEKAARHAALTAMQEDLPKSPPAADPGNEETAAKEEKEAVASLVAGMNKA